MHIQLAFYRYPHLANNLLYFSKSLPLWWDNTLATRKWLQKIKPKSPRSTRQRLLKRRSYYCLFFVQLLFEGGYLLFEAVFTSCRYQWQLNKGYTSGMCSPSVVLLAAVETNHRTQTALALTWWPLVATISIHMFICCIYYSRSYYSRLAFWLSGYYSRMVPNQRNTVLDLKIHLCVIGHQAAEVSRHI